MNKKTTAVIAGTAGALLLLGGGTFALWSDSAAVPASTITAGNLDVDIAAAEWFDVSADRLDATAPAVDSPFTAGHAINLDTFRIIPGDTVEARFPVTLDLQGENMLADLELNIGGANALTGALAPGISNITYTVIGEEDGVIGTKSAASLDVQFASSDNGFPGTATLLSDQEYTVVVSLTFNAATANQAYVTETASLLSTSTLQLNQVRTGAGYVAP